MGGCSHIICTPCTHSYTIYTSAFTHYIHIIYHLSDDNCHTRLHLGFYAKMRIWQVSACKMEPRSGIIFAQNRPDPTRPPDGLVCKCPSSASNTCLNVVGCPHSSLNIRPGDNCCGWSHTIPCRMVTTNSRMVTLELVVTHGRLMGHVILWGMLSY